MPIYEYYCKKCCVITEIFHKKIPDVVEQAVKCDVCGEAADKSVSRPGLPDMGFKPYWTEQLTPDPLYIESRKQEREICKKYKVVIS